MRPQHKTVVSFFGSDSKDEEHQYLATASISRTLVSILHVYTLLPMPLLLRTHSSTTWSIVIHSLTPFQYPHPYPPLTLTHFYPVHFPLPMLLSTPNSFPPTHLKSRQTKRPFCFPQCLLGYCSPRLHHPSTCLSLLPPLFFSWSLVHPRHPLLARFCFTYFTFFLSSRKTARPTMSFTWSLV